MKSFEIAVIVVFVIFLGIFLGALWGSSVVYEEIVDGKTLCKDHPDICKRNQYRKLTPYIPTVSFDQDFKPYLSMSAIIIGALYAIVENVQGDIISEPKLKDMSTKPMIIGDTEYPYLALFFESKDKQNAYLIFRGTQTVADMETDITYTQTKNTKGNLVHKGFYELYTERVVPKIKDINWKSYKQVFISGHSLGASLAIIAYSEIDVPSARCLAIAPPRTGSPEFATTQMTKVKSLINLADLVPTGPLAVMATLRFVYFYEHGPDILTFTQNLRDLRLNHNQYTYLDHFIPPQTGPPSSKSAGVS